MVANNEESEVVNFFNDGHILVTGSTGFLGKILVDKLLRDCRGVSQLYLLIRVKKGKEPTARLKELFDDPVFVRLKKEYPEFLGKVSVVAGDCSSPGLGLSEQDRGTLAEKVTHIFHGAATVRFDEKLRHAITVNVQGVKEMMSFCQTCTKLKSVIHISTAYSHCPRHAINENFYDAPITGESALKLLQCLDDSKLDLITPDLIKPWPNTYSYTKAIAEDIIQKNGQDLPIGVFRPSIVIATVSEPVPGWIDNFYGPTGVICAVGAGLMRVLNADSENFADLVPVDFAVNALICCAKDVGTAYAIRKAKQVEPESLKPEEEKTKIPIYHYVASRENPLTWGKFLEYNLEHGRKVPTIKSIWFYTITLTKSWPLYQMLTIFYHLLPALIMDLGLLISGNKAQLWRGYTKVHKFSRVISFFSTSEWIFGKDNTTSLWKRLSGTDKQLFPFDMNTLDWNEFFKNNVVGIRLYLFHDPPSTLPAARRKMFMFQIAHRLLQAILAGLFLWTIYSIFSAVYTTPPGLYTEHTRWPTQKMIGS